MAGENLSFPLPLVESGKKYAPGSLAKEITNLRLTSEGTLRAVRGPAPYIPDYGAGYPWPGRVYGVYHTLLDEGTRDVLLVRSGTQLFEQTGWNIAVSPVRVLASDLSSDPNARYPDVFVEVAGKVVWSNGVDTPRIYDGYRILPLGYDLRPGAPSAIGPQDSGHVVFRNQSGYSHPGRIGTPGNFFAPQSGALLAGNWYDYVQFEDVFGNRSPLSAPAGPVAVRQEYTKDLYWVDYDNYSADTNNTDAVLGITLYPGTSLGAFSVQIDDLTRQFLVGGLPIGPPGTVARLVYRSADALHNDPTPKLLERIDDNVSIFWPDNAPDSLLGAPAKDYIAVPRFHIACEHGGCLVIAEGRTIRMSEPFFPGNFERDSAVPLPGDPTALFSYGEQCYAATESALYRIERTERGLEAFAIPQGRGMVGPQAGCVTGVGVFVGFARDGAWAMTPDEMVRDIFDEMQPLLKRLTVAALPRATAVWDPNTRALLLALPEAGTFGNTLVLTWDGSGWRRYRLGVAFASLCVTRDWRRYVLAGGLVGGVHQVLALDRNVSSWTPPSKTYAFKSHWLKMDAMGRNRFNVDAIYVGIVESVVNGTITWQTWKNGTRDAPANAAEAADRVIEMANPSLADAFDTLVLNTGKTRTPRLTWKRIDVRVKSVESFAFDLTSTSPMHIAAFSFDAYIVDANGARVSRE